MRISRAKNKNTDEEVLAMCISKPEVKKAETHKYKKQKIKVTPVQDIEGKIESQPTSVAATLVNEKSATKRKSPKSRTQKPSWPQVDRSPVYQNIRRCSAQAK